MMLPECMTVLTVRLLYGLNDDPFLIPCPHMSDSRAAMSYLDVPLLILHGLDSEYR